MAERVFVVDDRPDILELNRILLEAEGYETEGHAYADVTSETLHAAAPRVLLLDLPWGDETPWAFLRRLRSDERTREIGVVVTSGSSALIDTALADAYLRVSAGLMMPFEIDALYAAVAAAAGHVEASPAPTRSNPASRAGVVALREGRTRILLAWVQRLSALDAFKMYPDLLPAEVQGQGPVLLDLIVETLDRGEAAPLLGVSDAARVHGRTRRRQGMPASCLAQEIAALRHETWRAVYGVVAPLSPPLADLWETLRRLDATLDDALGAMLDAWAKQEDYGDAEETGRRTCLD